jgi:cyclopropane-fatty-acyl-phospholipid synthase
MAETIVPPNPERHGDLAGPAGRASLTDRAATALAGRLAQRLHYGTLVISDGAGRTRYGTSRPDEPVAQVTVADPRTYAALLRRGSVGLGQSYVEGWWECDDLTALVRILIRNIEGPGRVADRSAQVVRRLAGLKHRSAPRDKRTDRRHVQAHYDLGNDFFELMLDPTMMYSCGVFEHPDATLEQASTAKLDRICKRLALGPEDHVLEIGTGWGGFAVHAAAHYGCRVTTTTISDAQYDYAAKRVAESDLGDLVTVLNDDYRDLTGTYDKLVSIEMVEAIGWKQFDTFFSTCSRLLRDTGLMALQAIVIADHSYERAKRRDDFIKQMLFPGGCLPSIEAITRSCTRATDLRVVHLDDIGLHYAETLRRWRANFTDRIDDVSAIGLGVSFQRLWQLYLCYCEAAFVERHVSDVQLVLAKPRSKPSPQGIPLDRGRDRVVALRSRSRSTAATA